MSNESNDSGKTADLQHSHQQSRMRQPRNIVASVNARLLMLAKERNEEFQIVLMRYGLERLLYRLGQSPYAGQFVVKGAMLFTLWAAETRQSDVDTAASASPANPSSETAARSHELPALHRATHDLDLLGFGASDLSRLEQVFRDLCQLAVAEDDGLTFSPDSVQVAPIREDQEYGGVRTHLLAMLGKARIPLQVDIGFGDVVTPAPASIAFPTLLPTLPAPQVRVYPRETVVAEKFEALVRLGLTNTRMKDFYDLWTLANQFAFDGALLSAALRATFTRRGSALPGTHDDIPVALTARFGDDRVKRAQWTAFLRKSRIRPGFTLDLPDVQATLRAFLLPPGIASVAGQSFDQRWPIGGPWSQKP